MYLIVILEIVISYEDQIKKMTKNTKKKWEMSRNILCLLPFQEFLSLSFGWFNPNSPLKNKIVKAVEWEQVQAKGKKGEFLADTTLLMMDGWLCCILKVRRKQK